jgi:hypothetical protein
MKKIIFLVIVFSFFFASCEKENDDTTNCNFVNFYYYGETQIPLGELSNDYIVIGIDTTYSDGQIRNFISTVNQLDQNYDYRIRKLGPYKFKVIPVKLNSSKSCEEITQIIADLEQNEIVAYVHYAMQTDICKDLLGEPMGNLCINGYRSSFLVNVFDKNNLTSLNQMIAQTNTELVKQNEFMLDWFELRATKNSKGDALKMANFFHESGLFAHSEPEISKYPVE